MTGTPAAAAATLNPSKAVVFTARGLCLILAVIFVYFGTLYFTDPEVTRVINVQLGYPLYVIAVIGATHILGGIGLLIPNLPRFTEWVYAGLTIDLLLAGYSHASSGDSIGNTMHPIGLLVIVAASYMLRRRIGLNLWSRH